MASRSARLLCVGKELDLLRTRCDVLSQSGYDGQSASLEEAEALLLKEEFDLVIVSAWLTESERDRILAAAGLTPTLVLHKLTFAPELLAEVERRLSSTRQESSK
jgi:hypothetical protein